MYQEIEEGAFTILKPRKEALSTVGVGIIEDSNSEPAALLPPWPAPTNLMSPSGKAKLASSGNKLRFTL
jgi:hypothetical protein